jgi:hypothetical protein
MAEQSGSTGYSVILQMALKRKMAGTSVVGKCSFSALCMICYKGFFEKKTKK